MSVSMRFERINQTSGHSLLVIPLQLGLGVCIQFVRLFVIPEESQRIPAYSV